MRADIRMLGATFGFWSRDYIARKSLNRARDRIANIHLLRGKFAIWKEEHLHNKQYRIQQKQAEAFHSRFVQRHHFGIFLELLDKGRAAKRLEVAFVHRGDSTAMRQAFHDWRILFLQVCEDRRLERHDRTHVLGIAMRSWVAYIQQSKDKKIKLGRAERLYKKNLRRLTQNVFQSWAYSVEAKKIRFKKQHNTINKRNKVLKREIFRSLQESRIRGLKDRLERVLTEHEEAKVIHSSKLSININL